MILFFPTDRPNNNTKFKWWPLRAQVVDSFPIHLLLNVCVYILPPAAGRIVSFLFSFAFLSGWKEAAAGSRHCRKQWRARERENRFYSQIFPQLYSTHARRPKGRASECKPINWQVQEIFFIFLLLLLFLKTYTYTSSSGIIRKIVAKTEGGSPKQMPVSSNIIRGIGSHRFVMVTDRALNKAVHAI